MEVWWSAYCWVLDNFDSIDFVAVVADIAAVAAVAAVALVFSYTTQILHEVALHSIPFCASLLDCYIIVELLPHTSFDLMYKSFQVFHVVYIIHFLPR